MSRGAHSYNLSSWRLLQEEEEAEGEELLMIVSEKEKENEQVTEMFSESQDQ